MSDAQASGFSTLRWRVLVIALVLGGLGGAGGFVLLREHKAPRPLHKYVEAPPEQVARDASTVIHEISRENNCSEKSYYDCPAALNRLPDAQKKTLLQDISNRLSKTPGDVQVQHEAMHVFYELDLNRCTQLGQEITKEDTEDYNSVFHLARAYLKKGDFKKALENAARALKLKDTADVHHLIGQIFFQEGRLDKAQEHLEKALALAPDDLASAALLDRTRILVKQRAAKP